MEIAATALMELRHAIRSLLRTPGFTAVAVLSLALGIGANAAIFSVVDALLLRPLPYAAPDGLLALRRQQSPPDLRDAGAQSRMLAAVAGYGAYPLDLVGRGEPEELPGALVAGPLFEALGVRPSEGRWLTRGDDRAYAVVLSDGLRHKLFGDGAAVGNSLLLSGKSFTVVGVMPPRFRLPDGESQLWVPAGAAYPEASEARGAHFLTGVARLAPHATQEQAQHELDAVAARLAQQYPAEDRDLSLALMPLQERVTREYRSTLLLLFAAVGLLLLVACANFGGLLLARGAASRHELAVRAALGATRGRIVQQLLLQSALLSLAGGAAAALLAAWCQPLLVSLVPNPAFAGIAIDGRVLLIAQAAALVSGLLVGLLPAAQSSRPDLHAVLQSAAPSHSGRTRLRSALVVVEIALAVVLLTGAGLVLRAVWKLRETPLGFDPARVLTLRLDLPGSRYREVPRQTAFFDDVLSRISALPGVEAAGTVSELPMSGERLTHNALIEGAPPVAEGAEPEVGAHVVSAGFFAALRIPLLEGRFFDSRDGAASAQVAIVNAAFASKYFPRRSAVGARLRYARETPARWMTIAGVVGDVRENLQQPAEPTVYVPYAQNASPWHRWATLAVRGSADVEAAVKKAVWAVDPALPVTRVRPMEQVLSASMAQRKLQLALLGLFAGLALLLGAVGIYGLVAYSVTQRTREIGVRMALGATRGRVLGMVLSQGLRLAVAGVAAGTAAALALGRLAASLLHGVPPADAPTSVAIAAVVAGAAALASLLPAWRAARIDPIASLRQ